MKCKTYLVSGLLICIDDFIYYKHISHILFSFQIMTDEVSLLDIRLLPPTIIVHCYFMSQELLTMATNKNTNSRQNAWQYDRYNLLVLKQHDSLVKNDILNAHNMNNI